MLKILTNLTFLGKCIKFRNLSACENFNFELDLKVVLAMQLELEL